MGRTHGAGRFSKAVGSPPSLARWLSASSMAGSGSFGSRRLPHDLFPLPGWPSRSSLPLSSVPIGDDQEQPSELLPLLQCALYARDLEPCRVATALLSAHLSWDSLTRVPHRRQILCASTPEQHCCRSSARPLPNGRHVPPSWFLTTSTVCSTLRPAGLLHPAASRGSSRFKYRSNPQPKLKIAGPNTLPATRNPRKKSTCRSPTRIAASP